MSNGRDARAPTGGLTARAATDVRGRLSDLLRRLRTTGTIYRFPWVDLERELASKRSFPLFGYGSLIDPHSAAVSILAQGDEPALATAFGITRVFEYEMPERALRKYDPPDDTLARAALNVRPADTIEASANGVVIRAYASDLPALRVREAGYDLIPVPFVPWSNPGAEPDIALTFACPADSADGIRYVRDDLSPHRRYLENCLRAASLISEEFLTEFLRTTFALRPDGSLERLDRYIESSDELRPRWSPHLRGQRAAPL